MAAPRSQRHSPSGLADATRGLPFLGRISADRDRLTAGEWTELTLTYEVGAAGLADGGWLKATFKFYSDWGLFQTVDPRAANYATAEYVAAPCRPGQSPATVQALALRFDQKGHERPYQKALIVDIVDGYLKAGDRIVLRLGDRRAGGPGTRVQTFVERDFRFRAYLDPLGTSRFGAVPGDVRLDIVPGPPAHLELITPRLCAAGSASPPVVLRLEDRWGNACVDTPLDLAVTASRDGQPALSRIVPTPSRGWAVARLDDLPTTAGELTLTATARPGIAPSAALLTFDPAAPTPRALFADLHVHSEDTVGINDTAYNLTYGRDAAGLDILGYTANDFQISAANWRSAVDAVNRLDEPGRFVCWPGIEWCGNSCAGGDRNVVYLGDSQPAFPVDAEGRSTRSFEWSEDMAGREITPGRWPVEELWATYAHAPEGHLLIPHVGGRRALLDWHDPELERLVEVASSWGHFGWLYEEAARRGLKVGVCANGDEHRGRCGGGAPGAAVFGVRGGLTGVLADHLDRPTIGRALRARHTWATTGERLVGLTRCGAAIQGDEVGHTGPAAVSYRFLGAAGIEEIRAFDHTGLFWRRDLHGELGLATGRVRVRFGGARVRDRYRAALWRGRITITGATVAWFQGRGFEHPEESCWRSGPTTIDFASETYGDVDAIELELDGLAGCHLAVEGTIGSYPKIGNPLAPHPFVHAPEFALTTTGAELLDRGSVRGELGGCELFVAIERITDRPLPREVTGTVTVDPVNAPFGFRPVFLEAREADGARVWTSAIYLDFAQSPSQESRR